MNSHSIVHDDASDSHATSSQASDPSTEFEEMRFFPQWIGCQRTSTATVSSTSSFQCHSPITYPVTEWGVQAFEEEVSVCFLPPPDVAYELDTPLRTQASSATLQPSGTVTPTPNSIARKMSDRTRRSSFLNFNLGNLFRHPANTSNNISNINLNLNYSDSLPRSTGLESLTHLPPPLLPRPPLSLSSSETSRDLSYNDNSHHHAYNTDIVSLPSVSSASVSTFASASAFTVASNPSISTYASVSASIAPSSVSASKSQDRKGSGPRSHISSSSWSYSYPYSEYMSSSSDLSMQDNYLEDVDDDRAQLEEPTSPTTTTASTTSASVVSSSKHSNLVRRFRLRGGADEQLLKPRSATATGISSSGLGITSSLSSPHQSSSSPASPSKLPFRSRFLLNNNNNDITKTSRECVTDEEDNAAQHSQQSRSNTNAKLKKRLILVELDEQGRMVENRRGGKVSSQNLNDDTLKPKSHLGHANANHTHNHNHNHNNETIGKSTSTATHSPLAVAAEHFSSTLSNSPFFHLRFRKQKRLLVKDIPTDDGEYTRSRIVALRQWAEGLGAVRRLLRSVPDGTIWIEFKDREVAENVCHLHAHVHIPNVGRVRLDWVEGREAG